MQIGIEGPRSLWQGGAPAAFGPQLRGEVAADLCVVGLGGSGLTAISEALALGKSVVGIDARTVAAGAAGRNGGLLLAGTRDFYHDACTSLGRERALAIYRETQAEIVRIAEVARRAVQLDVGSLRVATSADEWLDCEAQRDAMRADGLAAEQAETDFGRALLFPADASFDPYKRCRAQAKLVLRGGARLYEASPALDIAGDCVTTPHGVCRAARVIVAVDGGLERVLPELAGQVRTARLQMLSTEPAPEVRVPRPMYLRYGYEYMQQDATGRLAIGGFRDMFEDAEWTFDARPSDQVQAALTTFLRDTLRTDVRVIHRWAASVGYSKGSLPIFRETHRGALAIGGYSGTGNVIGALLGRAAVQLAFKQTSRLADLFTDSPSR